MDLERATNIFRENYSKWIDNDEKYSSGYEYERSFVEIMQNIEKELFKDSIGEVPINRNLKKKSKPRTGR